MDNPAETRYPIHGLLRNRWSPLAFADDPIQPDQLGSLLEAVRWSPSSYNEQPWAYIIGVRGEGETFDRLVSCLSEGNVPWAKHAPVLMLACAKLRFDKNGKPNRHAQHDVGLANASLVVQAEALGLRVHQMAGFDPDQARAEFGVPETHEPLTMIAVGHYGQPERLPDNYRQRERGARSRQPLEAFVFAGRWGSPVQLGPGGAD
ncbi:MAG: nitroreductase family protein [Planctomycetales bacterium]